tara:strand:- start:2724 stop:3089 length:366 start_codon:yes stop_codon:yes gene_type:complete
MFDYKSSALPTELNWLFLERRREIDVFPKRHQAFSVFFFSSTYAEICREGQGYPPKVAPEMAPGKIRLLRATFFIFFFKLFKNLSKQEENHLIKTLDCVHSVYYGYPRYGNKAGHKTNTQI